MKKIRYNVKGMSCASCVAYVERAAGKVLGKENVTVSLLTNTLTVSAPDDAREDKLYGLLSRAVKAAGYSISPADGGRRRRDQNQPPGALLVGRADGAPDVCFDGEHDRFADPGRI